MNKKSELLTRKEAAKYLGTTESTLAVWACTKRYQLPMVKIGRLVKYRLSDLENFIESRITNLPNPEGGYDVK
ncbi:helix-turn-helix domain-containing protein [Candidatus Odyssella thessalonicensis]|uniref:helix-turn-helix domain-containing protein n=1 Tax=Candidatus Odyssella thessalonicensis TaxID=84647 RepID=UPI000225ACA5|nr:helix-turn-helix domain-containing protein [Candidatus Odyssella thessalonicensis]